jgi:hypothetical protein
MGMGAAMGGAITAVAAITTVGTVVATMAGGIIAIGGDFPRGVAGTGEAHAMGVNVRFPASLPGVMQTGGRNFANSAEQAAVFDDPEGYTTIIL